MTSTSSSKKKARMSNQQQEPTRKENADQENQPEGESGEKESADEKLEVLRRQARFYCRDAQEWHTIAKWKESKLSDYVQEKSFEAQKALSDSAFDTIHKGLAVALDRLTKGHGWVEKEVGNDLTLRQSIQLEGSDLLFLRNNKIKIAILILIDSFHGKQRQREFEMCHQAYGGPEIVEEEEKGQRGASPRTDQ